LRVSADTFVSIDFGTNAGSPEHGWIQVTRPGNLSINYDLELQPNGGKVGIGQAPTTNLLEVNGTASKAAAGDWLANSDKRIKTDIQEINNPLELISKVRPVKFRYTDEYKALHPSIKDYLYYNIIAQEYQEVFPNAVSEDGTGLLQVDVHPMFITAVAAIKELKNWFENLWNKFTTQSKETKRAIASLISEDNVLERKIKLLKEENVEIKAENKMLKDQIGGLKEAVCEMNSEAKVCK